MKKCRETLRGYSRHKQDCVLFIVLRIEFANLDIVAIVQYFCPLHIYVIFENLGITLKRLIWLLVFYISRLDFGNVRIAFMQLLKQPI